MNWVAIASVGLVVGFIAGLFGKGGSAVATPLLHAVGVPAIIAVASPLPATIPSTLAATAAYWKQRLIDGEVLAWSLGIGIPATVAGAVGSRWVSGPVLVRVTDVVIAVLGARLLLGPPEAGNPADRPPGYRSRMAAVAVVVGATSGLLANSGGFLLAPLYIGVLRLAVKPAFACSLAVAAVLAVPGTIVHAALGHVDWALVAVFAGTSVPFSYAGAKVALRTRSDRLERVFGATLLILGGGLLFLR